MNGDFSYSFLAGVLAAVNPCGFVLLPAYLVYFLGLDSGDTDGPDTRRASLVRALTVSASVSGGFIAVFLVVGAITRLFTRVIQDNAKYVAFGIGFLFVGAGIAMLAGWKPAFTVGGVTVRRDRTVRAMFLYGTAYAIASIGCTLPLLTSVIFGSFSRHGTVSGILSVALYGAGMAMLVSALTVSTAFARNGLLAVSRAVMRHLHRVSAVLVTLTGAYLILYWWGPVTDSLGSGPVTSTVDQWQSELVTVINDLGAGVVATILVGILFVTVAVIDLTKRRGARGE
jgi:cytochrome c biogenesis protein CcdA